MIESNRGARLIFVGGIARSGTTLVQNMLDLHPDICGAPEFLHIPDIMILREKLYSSISHEFIDQFCSYNEVDSYICSLIESFLLKLADKHGCKFLSEKTPGNVLYFSELIKLFPKAHFIHVIRDPRAVISSMQQVGKRAKNKGLTSPDFTASVSAGIKHVIKGLNVGFTASNNAKNKILTVVYERLVIDPEIETKRICKFLGIEWTNQMIYPASKRHLGEKAITPKSEIWYDTSTYYRNPDSQIIDKWKNQLTLAQQVKITIAFRNYEELKQLGYDFSIENLTPTKRILALSYSIFFIFNQKLFQYLISIARKNPSIVWVKRRFFNFKVFIRGMTN